MTFALKLSQPVHWWLTWSRNTGYPAWPRSFPWESGGDWQLKSDKNGCQSFAISQILDNAIKYSKRGGHIQVQLDEDGIQISGHRDRHPARRFAPPFEEGFTGYNGHEHKKATGLGLYMTKQVLDKLDLAIRVHSQVEEGTQVFICREKS